MTGPEVHPRSAGHPGTAVTVVLRGELPHLLLYFDSMRVLGALWFGHRNAFEYVRRTTIRTPG